MADTTISALPTAANLAQADLFPIVQAGVTSKANMGQLVSLAAAFASTILTARATGTGDAMLASFNPQVAGLVDGAQYVVRAIGANTLASPTIALGTTPAKPIVKGANQPLIAADISGAGFWMELTYDLSLDKFVLLNPANSVRPNVSVTDPNTWTQKQVFAGGIDTTNLNGGPLAGFRNRFHNGNMRVNQRGPIVVTAGFLMDRWNVQGINVTFNASTDATLSLTGPSHVFLNCTTAKPALAAGDFAFLQQGVEGYSISDFLMGTAAAKSFTITFRAKCSTAGVYCLAIRNSATTRSYVTPITMSVGAATYSVTIPGDMAGTWLSDNGAGMLVSLCFASGATFFAPSANTWNNGNFIAVAAQSNGLDTLNRSLSFTDAQLELGVISTLFEARPYQVELALCQRYFQIVTGHLGGITNGGATNTYSASFPVSMRVTPTMTIISTSNNGAGEIIQATSNYNYRFACNYSSGTGAAFFSFATSSASADI